MKRHEMVEVLSIQNTLNRYSEGVSRGDWDQAVATYRQDAVWEVSGTELKFHGTAEIRQGLQSLSEPFAYLVQINAPAVISIVGDQATARSVIREGGKYKHSDEAMEGYGWYEDSLTRTADGWRFIKRIYHIRGMHRVPILGPVQAVLAQADIERG
jgi:ketosteroid isomerase-like protein